MIFLNEKKEHFSRIILNWWNSERREFPWRKTNNPYHILITEILLRKTTAKQVKSIYNDFFEKYPTIHKLADTNSKDLEKLLYPLGMEKKRSIELLKLSNVTIDNYKGKIPSTKEKLIELPGVGEYTAGGVLCQAYKKDSAMVDTNVVRVVTRYFSYKSSRKRPRDDPKLWSFVKELIPPGKCKQFNLGLIDFAGDICTSRNPKCQICPLSKMCDFIN